ncbi:trigger factor [soil metagenome]
MDIKIKDLENCAKEFDAVLTYDELKPHFEKAILKYKNKAAIPGFRKGKAPLGMIRKMYGDSIEYSALEDICNDVFKNYVKENNIEILEVGSILDMDYKPKENFKFAVSYEVYPDNKLNDYSGLELTKNKNVIDDTLVDEEIKYHVMRNAGTEIDGQATDDEYIVTVDLQNLDSDGNVLEGESQKNIRTYLNNPEIFPEFKEGFKNIKEGETRIIDSKNSKGEPKKVQIVCTKVEKVVQPEMNEEFFKKVTGKEEVKTEEEFKTAIKAQLQEIYDNNSKMKLSNDVINEMIKINDFIVPEKYIRVITDSMVENEKKERQNKKSTAEFNEEEYRKSQRVSAIKQAKWYLIREKMIEDLKLDISDADYEKKAEGLSKSYNIPLDKVVEYYKSSPDIKMEILNDKVIDLIIEKAKITEKEVIRSKESEAQNHDHSHSHDHDHDHEHQHEEEHDHSH